MFFLINDVIDSLIATVFHVFHRGVFEWIMCARLFFSEDTSMNGNRQKKGPADNGSDIEHLLLDQPMSEFISGVCFVFKCRPKFVP